MPHPKGAEPQHSPIVGVLLYLWLHLFTQNYLVRQASTRWDGACYFRSAMPPKGQAPAIPILGDCFICSIVAIVVNTITAATAHVGLRF